MESGPVPGLAPAPDPQTLTPDSRLRWPAFPFLSPPVLKTLFKVSDPLPTSAKKKERFLEEQLQTRQNFVLGYKLPPPLISLVFTP